MNKNIAVIGDGGWGTTLAIILAGKGYSVTLWGAFPKYVSQVKETRINEKFLPDIKIPRQVVLTHDLEEALYQKDIVVLTVPSQYIRGVLEKIKKNDYPRRAIYLSGTKGIEIGTLCRISQIIEEELGKVKIAVLSGPTIAHEVALGVPTAAVIAANNREISKSLQEVFMTDAFRIYTNSDVIGVELGGSLKNIIAIACGISDGLGFGTNTKAALLARGLAEISRLGKAMGARQNTFSGISGLGDLVTTCISQYSRNRFVGEQIGKGISLKDINSKMQMVAEGLPTTKSVYELSIKYRVDMPITSQVYSVIYKNKPAYKAVRDLMTRQGKSE
ncbi:MAG: NAD(P)-dependent glycerol-3-phosphate dehydrogenase [Candidatus Omnitrophota bacterium]|jgi:glycerol-3-phosphate dehydrogenase (NAD(P)+)|nr:MAG: NAD(P)-dependent glycerol-3-phosphate dehydrogenase [Candidatus Omnitrophota bacterium]